MSRKLRVLSQPSATILRRFVTNPADELHGFKIIQETGLRSSTLYPALRLLAEERQFLISRWEDSDADHEGPRRRLYRLNGDAEAVARAHDALQEFDQRMAALGLDPIPQPT